MSVLRAEGREGGPANWEIDEQQEKFIEQWAKAANLWEDDSANVFIDTVTGKPICIDCIVKFVNPTN